MRVDIDHVKENLMAQESAKLVWHTFTALVSLDNLEDANLRGEAVLKAESTLMSFYSLFGQNPHLS